MRIIHTGIYYTNLDASPNQTFVVELIDTRE